MDNQGRIISYTFFTFKIQFLFHMQLINIYIYIYLYLNLKQMLTSIYVVFVYINPLLIFLKNGEIH